jgi:hypothetical protein
MSAYPSTAAQKRTVPEIGLLGHERTHVAQQLATYSITLSARASHGGRYFEAKRLCCFEIDDQFVSGGCLNREIGRFLSLENAIYILCSEPFSPS